MLKKLFIITFAIITLLSVNVFPVMAASTDDFMTYEEFERLQEENIVGKDVTYVQLKELQKESISFEKALESNASFNKVFDNTILSTRSISIKSGDVIITNSTSSSGLLGHSAIALGSNEILDIPGPGKSVRTLTVSAFCNDYADGWIKVYRPTTSSWGTSAATWARSTYKGSNAVYKITNNINSTNETYCSKIVFQAYKFGVGSSAFNTYYHEQGDYYGSDYNLVTGIIAPYTLPTSLSVGLKGNL